MTATAVDPARARQLDRYVAFDALSTLLTRIVEAVDDRDPDHQALPIEAGMLTVGDGKIVDGSDVALNETLWPEDDDMDGIEYALAAVRSSATTARILILLASDEGRDWMLAEAGRLSEVAARRVAKTQVQIDEALNV